MRKCRSCGEVPEGVFDAAVEGGVGVDHASQRVERDAGVDGEGEQAEDVAAVGSHGGGADEHAVVGVGEGDSGKGAVVGRYVVVAEDVGDGDGGLVHGDVGERPTAADVADRPDPVGDPLVSVDGDPSLGLVDADGADADQAQVGTTSGRDQQPLGRERLAVGQGHRDLVALLGDGRSVGSGADPDTLAGEHAGEQVAGFGFLDGTSRSSASTTVTDTPKRA